MGRPRPKKISKAEQRSHRRKGLTDLGLSVVAPVPVQSEKPRELESIQLPATLVMKELADRLSVPIGKLLTIFIRQGIMVTINSSVDFETAALVIEELGFAARKEERIVTPVQMEKEGNDDSVEPRPPIVTVMGHVDHGKTSLLDAIRNTDIASGESGGITQHIGAYQVEISQPSQPETKSPKPSPPGRNPAKAGKNKSDKRSVTFLDTPGHEAFAALRAHGANLTDVVVLVVAADDGVRPQTLEALSHARAANVPIVVALTKIDLPGADITKVKAQLAEEQLISEEWGGKTPMVGVSSKTKEGVTELLEMILLVADLEDYRSSAAGPAKGIVIESHQEVGLGPVATVLVERGTLRQGDILVSGESIGRVRNLRDWRGLPLREAHPSDPVQVAGFKLIPGFGQEIWVVGTEKAARTLIEQYRIARPHPAGRVNHEVSELDFPVILKADTQGSVEALKNVLRELTTGDIQATILAAGIGPVSDSDVHLAAASDATILAFGVTILKSARELALHEKIRILSSKIIYELIDLTVTAMNARLAPVTSFEEIGRIKVLKIFSTKKLRTVLGGSVSKGRVEVGSKITIRRLDAEVGRGTIISLRQGPNEIREIGEGQEIGLGMEATTIPAPGDVIDVTKEVIRERSVHAPATPAAHVDI